MRIIPKWDFDALKPIFAQPIYIDRDNASCVLEPIRIAPNGPYNESWLQERIHEHPECLPVREIEKGFDRPVAICRELPTASGPIDNFLITPDGDLIVVETKLWKNAEARRTVVAQALDYASCLFAMSYEDLERAVLAAKTTARNQKKTGVDSGPPPRSLFQCLAHLGEMDETSFIDSVSRNLRLGRALVMVVGDGIRSEAIQLAALLQGNPMFNFTFALVEMNIFRLEADGGLILYPRVLTKTEMIPRATVVVDDMRVKIELPPTIAAKASAVTENITAAQFYDAMAKIRSDLPDKLRTFIAELEPLGVYPDFQRSLNFRWDPPEGRTISLGYISRNGEVWTDTANYKIPPALGHRYNERLAAVWNGQLRKPANGAWSVQIDGHAPRIGEVSETLAGWIGAIKDHIDGVRDIEAAS